MTAFGENLALLLVRELSTFERELDLFPDDASAWKTGPGIANSSANLALHVSGNLRHFVGTVLGGTGYVRHREREFGKREGAREDVKAELRAAIRDVETVLPSLPGDAWTRPYPEPVNGVILPTDRFLMHLCSHAAYHLGQASFVRRVVTGQGTSSGPVPLGPLGLRPAP